MKINVTKIAAGNWHSLVLDECQKIYGTGHNKYGALGIGKF